MAVHPWNIARAMVKPPVFAMARPIVTGVGNVPGRGGVILAANHLSYVDIFLLAAASPRAPRYIGKTELTRGFVGRVVALMGMIAVERGRGDLDVVRRVAALLGDGAVIGIFPEGTRSPDGRLYRFRSGTARAAALAGVPTVPVTIRGTQHMWPKGGKPALRRQPPGVVAIHFHDPIPPPADDPRSRRAFTDHVTSVIAAGCDQPLADCFAPLTA